MSKTIDQRVVEMRFDNQHFEKNVKTSMSTLEKLKQSLKLDSATKGLNDLSSAAKKVDMSGLSNGVETVRMRFSALDVFGVTALTRISNAAITAGKNIVKSLTITPVTTGFSEYELKMGSIQTIMASTGESLETVNKYLNDLNEYSDKTIYSFSDMTQNIGKFTNAGVKLEDAVLAIKGIANEAALSGANTNEASRAMYNFAQALSAGYVKLIDWKSIELANMATKGFKEQLIETAVQMGTLTKVTDGYKTAEGKVITATKNFNDSLQDQWMTSDVLINTLKKYTDTSTKIGEEATRAATEVKTFTQMLDALKESAQSGWARTWEIVFGDFYEGKELWTSIYTVVDGVLSKINDARNNMLDKVFNNTTAKRWEQITKRISDAGVEVDYFKEKLIEVAKKHGVTIDKMVEEEGSLEKTLKNGWLTKDIFVETLQKIIDGNEGVTKSTEDMTAKLNKFKQVVEDVWHGTYKNGTERAQALTEAGYEYAEVQELVNKTVNDHKLDLEDLTEAQMKAVGYTDEEIEALTKLQEEAKATGASLNQLIEDMDKSSGRELLVDTFTKLKINLDAIFDSIGKGWKKIFPYGSSDGSFLYNIIDGINKLVNSFGKIDAKTADNFERIGAGLAAIYDIAKRGISASLTTGIKLLSAVLGLFDLNLLDVVAHLADYIVAFDNWLSENTLYINTIDKLARIIKAIVDGVIACAKAFYNLEGVQHFISDISDIFEKLFGVFTGIGEDATGVLKAFNIDNIVLGIERLFTAIEKWISVLDKTTWFQNMAEAGTDIVEGLAHGIADGAEKVFEEIQKVATELINKFCDVLGIESPSKVFMALGAFIIMGLIEGIADGKFDLFTSMGELASGLTNAFTFVLQNGIPFILDVVKTLGSKILEIIKSFDLGSVIVLGSIVGIFLFLKKISGFLENITNPLENISNVFENTAGAIDKLAKAKTNEIRSVSLLNIAKAILMLAGALFVLSKVNQAHLWSAVGAVGAIVGVLYLMLKATEKMNVVEIASLSGLMLAIGAAMLIMAGALKILSTISVGEAGNAIAQMIIIVGAMGVLLWTYGNVMKDSSTAEHVSKAGGMLFKMAVGLAVIAVALKIVATMSLGDIGKGILVVTAVGVLFSALVWVSWYAGEHAWQAGSMIKKMGTAILAIAVAMKLIATMSWSDVAKGLIVVAGIEMLFSALIFVSFFAGKYASRAGTMLLKMSIAIGILALAMKLIATMSWSDIQKGMTVLDGVYSIFASLIVISLLAREGTKIAGNAFLKMAAAITILAVAMKIIATVEAGDVVKALGVILAIEILFAGIIVLTNIATKNAHNASAVGTMLFKMAGAILVLSLAIAVLSVLDPKDIWTATGAIAALMGCFAVLIGVTAIAGEAADTLKSLMVACGVLVASIVILSALDPSRVKTATTCIMGVVGMFALLVAATKLIGTGKEVFKTLLTLSGVAVLLTGIVAALSFINPDKAVPNTIAISVLLATMAGVMAILSIIKTVSFSAIGAMALMGLVVAELAVILGVMSHLDVNPSIETATALSTLLLAMSAALVILIPVGTFAVQALAGVGVLAVFIAAIGGLIVGIGALMTEFPKLEEFLNKGMPILEKIGYTLGSFFGNIIKGFGESVTSALPAMGENLGSFMDNAKPFFDGLKDIDSDALSGIKTLSEILLTLTATNIADGFMGWFSGSSSLVDFGEQLVEFGGYISEYSDKVNGINATAIENSATAAKALADVANAIPNAGGLKSLWSGNNDMDTFGTKLVGFGNALVNYGTAINTITPETAQKINDSAAAAKALVEVANAIPQNGGLESILSGSNDMDKFGVQLVAFGNGLAGFAESTSGIDATVAEKIKLTAEAAKALAEMAATIPNTGGLKAMFSGENSITTFGSELESLGTNLSNFATNLGTFDQTKVETVVNAAKAVTEMAKAAGEIPEQGGWAAKLFGDNSIGSFGDQMPGLATNLNGFVQHLGTFSGEQVETVKCAGKAIKALAEASGSIDGQSGWAAVLFGDNSLSTFGGELGELGKGLASFVSNLGTFSDEQVATVESAVKAVKAFATLANADLYTAAINFPIFGSNMVAFGEDLATFVKKLSGTETNGISESLTNLVKSVTKTAEDIAGQKSNFETALSDLVDAGKKAITDKKDSFTEATKTLLKAMKTAVDDNTSVKKAFTKLAGKAVDGLEDCEEDFTSAGEDLGDGLILGINSKQDAAYRAGYILGQKAVQGEKDGQESNSPSEATHKAGRWIGEGLVNGIIEMAKKVYNAGHDLGREATSSISAAVSKVSNLINSDMDAQPTIRPVLDLSEVAAGAGQIRSLFDTNPSVGVLSNVRAINSMMNRNQNGTTNDVISAIRDLKDGMQSSSDTYNINGITYDDGSNVSDAVRQIIRAAKIERRS